eukprot:TRINITY_DN94202_c0_g1_i1.p1 TRINITY_DN94202_c0_g1~~TRINITY_DN94202_c0_g1_i1.p1  ORF type:complete len:320 (-),score=68.01 TRINITY_DN94202_c0_g1_i1:13-951(-)
MPPKMVEAQLLRRDLPLKECRAVQDAVVINYTKLVKFNEDKKLSKQARWEAFACTMKTCLDNSLKPHWHVLIGASMGYACQKRERCMAIWKVEDCRVLIWKSPGVEGPTAAPADQDAGIDSDPAKVPVLKVLRPKEIEAGSELENVVAAIRAELPKLAGKDTQSTAQAIRRRLQENFGPIWHVLAGKEFAVEAAEDSRNMFLVSIDDLRVVGFQHEQFAGRFLDNIDFQKLISGLPYLLVVLLCFSYMALSSLCKEGAEAPKWSISLHIQHKMCYETWEHDIGVAAALILAGTFGVRKMKYMRDRIQKPKSE